MAGFGSQPYGSSPYGLGTPGVAVASTGKILQDTNSGDLQGSRKIDPYTKDYVLVNGRIAGMSDTQQLVLLAVSTTKGSAAVRSLGTDLRRIDRITGSFLGRVRNTLISAVQHIVDRDLIEVIAVTTEIVRPGVARAYLQWRDIATNTEHTTEVT